MTVHEHEETLVDSPADDSGCTYRTSVKFELCKSLFLLCAVAVLCFSFFMLGYWTVPPGFVYVERVISVPPEIQSECSSKITEAGCIASLHCGFCTNGESSFCAAGNTFGPWDTATCCTEWQHHTHVLSEEMS